jgi:hypothetical protein
MMMGFSYVDGQYQGQLTQCDGGPSCLQQLRLGGNNGGLQPGQRLDIVVESYGRLTYPIRADPEPFKKVDEPTKKTLAKIS